jgi:WhiB family redox-sensing transcriptional regulator
MNRQTNWRMRAACRTADPELFFPEGTSGPALEAVGRAKSICRECPVRARCLDWALTHNAAFGIWGGRTEGERRALPAVSARRRGEETSHPDRNSAHG